jgi:hypothetical protein
MCAYGGTSTLEAPLNPVPQNLADARDMVVFYPITRCYAHDFSDDLCTDNANFNKNLMAWSKIEPKLPIVIGEYYNVSKFEDLPLLFTKRMSNDIPYYINLGVKAITYMHLPMINWAMRTLNQVLYAELSWNAKADVSAIMNEYFENWYGKYASEMKATYVLLEESWQYCANMRSWSASSILSQLMMWNGENPEKPLDLDMHFNGHKDLIEKCNLSILKMEKVLEIVNGVRQDIKNDYCTNKSPTTLALNPTDLAKLSSNIGTEFRVAEDFRQVIYGIDTMTLMTSMVEYYDAMYTDSTATTQIWNRIEQIFEKLDSYYIPLAFDCPKVGLSCRDALARTQLRDIIKRCRCFRKSKNNV